MLFGKRLERHPDRAGLHARAWRIPINKWLSRDVKDAWLLNTSDLPLSESYVLTLSRETHMLAVRKAHYVTPAMAFHMCSGRFVPDPVIAFVIPSHVADALGDEQLTYLVELLVHAVVDARLTISHSQAETWDRMVHATTMALLRGEHPTELIGTYLAEDHDMQRVVARALQGETMDRLYLAALTALGKTREHQASSVEKLHEELLAQVIPHDAPVPCEPSALE